MGKYKTETWTRTPPRAEGFYWFATNGLSDPYIIEVERIVAANGYESFCVVRSSMGPHGWSWSFEADGSVCKGSEISGEEWFMGPMDLPPNPPSPPEK